MGKGPKEVVALALRITGTCYGGRLLPFETDGRSPWGSSLLFSSPLSKLVSARLRIWQGACHGNILDPQRRYLPFTVTSLFPSCVGR